MESNDVGRIAGGIFLAITRALSEEAARAATDLLYRWADNEDLRIDDRRIFRCIADAATRDAAELDAEYDQLKALEAGPTLRVVGGSSVTISTY